MDRHLEPRDIEQGGDIWLMLVTAGYNFDWPRFRHKGQLEQMSGGMAWWFLRDEMPPGCTFCVGLAYHFHLEFPAKNHVLMRTQVVTAEGNVAMSFHTTIRRLEAVIEEIEKQRTIAVRRMHEQRSATRRKRASL